MKRATPKAVSDLAVVAGTGVRERGGSERSPAKRSEREPSGGGGGVELVRPAAPDPEVVEKPIRRQFSAAYKLGVLREADGCCELGEIGALLRREGLYSSHLSAWRRQRAAGELAGLSPRRRGRKAKERNPLQRRLAQLERDKAKLTQRLQQAELIIEFQKKVSEILGIPLGNHQTTEDDS